MNREGEESDDSEESEEEDEEPQLKYQRLGAGVTDILKKDSASCLYAHDKFLILGTVSGAVYMLDFSGYLIKRFKPHDSKVNALSVDQNGDFVASCSDDGKVVIANLFDGEVSSHTYSREMLSVALHPQYSKKRRIFCCGGRGDQFLVNTQRFYGTKDNVLHQGEGPIHAVQWRGHLIAWANDFGVKIYDYDTTERISYIGRSRGSPPPEKYRCCLCWENDSTLLIGWGDSVKVGQLKLVKASGQAPQKQIHIIAVFLTEFYICGLAAYNENLVVLAYFEENDYSSNEEEHPNAMGARRKAERPELRIISRTNQIISEDMLPIRGYENYKATDYRLDSVTNKVESMFYITSPKDIVVAMPRTVDDRIKWMMTRNRFKEALELAEMHREDLKKHSVHDVGERYLKHILLEDKDSWDLIPQLCPRVFAKSTKLWENWIKFFAKFRKLKLIIPCIPTHDPVLSATCYELVLNSLLEGNHEAFLKHVEQWPATLYDIETVITAVVDKLNTTDRTNQTLTVALAVLYKKNKQYDKTLSKYLEIQQGPVFQLIEDYDLFDTIKDKVFLLMQFDEEKSVELFCHHKDRIPVQNVVSQLQNPAYRKYLHTYLDYLCGKNPAWTQDYHSEQVALYAEFAPEKLLAFLRISNKYVLDNAHKICESRIRSTKDTRVRFHLYESQVHILDRMGNSKAALEVIVKHLKNVKKAVTFVDGHKDPSLWDLLIDKALEPKVADMNGQEDFVSGLLENIGTTTTSSQAVQLIRKMPDELKIPKLRQKLIRILDGYSLETSLRSGANNILKNDCITLSKRLFQTLNKAIAVGNTSPCEATTTATTTNPLYSESHRSSTNPFLTHKHSREIAQAAGFESPSKSDYRTHCDICSEFLHNEPAPLMKLVEGDEPVQKVEALPVKPLVRTLSSLKQRRHGRPELKLFFCGHVFHLTCYAQWREKTQYLTRPTSLKNGEGCPKCQNS